MIYVQSLPIKQAQYFALHPCKKRMAENWAGWRTKRQGKRKKRSDPVARAQNDQLRDLAIRKSRKTCSFTWFFMASG